MKLLRRLALSLSLLPLAVACGGSTKPAADPIVAKVDAPAAKEAAPKGDDAPKTGSDAPKPASDAPKGPLKFASFPGPNVAPPKGRPSGS